MEERQEGMSFDGPLVYENIDGSRLRLKVAFVYWWRCTSSITVPEGFECDGQSYPRMFWFVDHPQGRGAKAGFVHDYLYWLNGRPDPRTGLEYDRAKSDRVFLDALIDSGVGKFRARFRYRMLRMFGMFAWNKHSKRIKKEMIAHEEIV